MDVRNNGKKMNFKRIYSQIAKYGRIIPELAEEYAMEENAFIERMQMGLDSKLFPKVMKANERNLKYRQNAKKNHAVIINANLEDKNMAINNEEQPENNKANALKEKEQELTESKNQDSTPKLSVLRNSLLTISNEISVMNGKLEEANKVLVILEENVKEKEKALTEATEALAEAEKKRNNAKDIVNNNISSIEELKLKEKSIETQIIELQDKIIYLVASGYKGEKPELVDDVHLKELLREHSISLQ